MKKSVNKETSSRNLVVVQSTTALIAKRQSYFDPYQRQEPQSYNQKDWAANLDFRLCGVEKRGNAKEIAGHWDPRVVLTSITTKEARAEKTQQTPSN